MDPIDELVEFVDRYLRNHTGTLTHDDRKKLTPAINTVESRVDYLNHALQQWEHAMARSSSGDLTGRLIAEDAHRKAAEYADNFTAQQGDEQAAQEFDALRQRLKDAWAQWKATEESFEDKTDRLQEMCEIVREMRQAVESRA